MEKILYKDNLNRAYKRVKANKGPPGTDGITVDEIGAYLRDKQEAIIERIYKGKYTPDPVRRKEIPKADGGMRKLGIPKDCSEYTTGIGKDKGICQRMA